jgi:predicted ATPase
VLQLTEAINELRQAKFAQYLSTFLLAQADGLAQLKRGDQALQAINEALDHVERTKEQWCLPELLRTRGELAFLQTGSPVEAETYFQHAIELARTQGALSWELRVATSLARSRKLQGKPADGREILAPALKAFTEGLDSQDVTSATALLRALR